MTFTTHHLRFIAEVETPIELNAFKGSALRGAWQSYLQTLYCAQASQAQADPLHQAMCPVCYILNRDTGSGADRRPYAFMPPLSKQSRFEPGERFSFNLSVFGLASQFMPYFILSVGQMGQTQGIGKFLAVNGHKKERGRFKVIAIEALNPFTAQSQCVLAIGTQDIHPPNLPISQADVQIYSQNYLSTLNSASLSLNFLTPTRIINDKRLVHTPQFGPFFARLVSRVTALQGQYANMPRLTQSKWTQLMTQAEQVRLVQDDTHWWDVEGHSSRLKQSQKLGGYIGQASYHAPDKAIWAELLPWLVWGTVTQVGKHTVKGCGWYSLEEEV